ncbi:MAG: fused MFS/spermidine synthase [Micropruina sp.]|uniref:spermidine synthase n=1 Tax=Micropruina sp. TaxID=2737536 RepID=UPI0039E61D21
MADRVEADREVRGAFLVRTGATQQSWVDPGDPLRLEFEYIQRIAEMLRATVLRRPDDVRLRVVHLGGGGMTLPRWLAAVRPGTAQIVCEPDADLLVEVRRKLPLDRHSGVKVRTTDGRGGLAAMPADYADALIVDAFDGLHVPGSLATAEFFADAGRVLRPDGVALMNLADQAPFGWSQSCLAGFAASFPQLLVTAETAVWKGRRYGNLVALGTRVRLPLTELETAAGRALFGYRARSGPELRRWLGGAEPFTDDAPQDSAGPANGRSWFS